MNKRIQGDTGPETADRDRVVYTPALTAEFRKPDILLVDSCPQDVLWTVMTSFDRITVRH